MKGLEHNRWIIYRFGDFELHPHTRSLLVDGKPVSIQPKPFDVLLYLIRHRNEVISRDRLRAEVWPEACVNHQAVSFALHVARKAVQDDGARQAVIRTLPRVGVQFVASVEEILSPLGGETTPGPPRRFPFVGRDEWVTRFQRSLECAKKGGGALLLIAAGPGLGKSRLLQELATAARAEGYAVAEGRCTEIGGAPPYWPWVQILEGLRKSARDEALELWEEVSQPRSRAVAAVAAGEERADRFRWFDRIREFLRRNARSRPCALLLDDFHRADLPSLRLLAYLADELASLGIVIVVAHREFELLGDKERSASFGRITRALRAETVRLEGLCVRDVAELAGSVATPSPGLAGRLHEHTGGNPFFLVQLLALMRAGSPVGNMDLPPGLPPTVRLAVIRHLDALPSGTRQLLAIAAVLGRGFDIDLLVKVSGTEAPRVLAQIAPAVAAGVLGQARSTRGYYWFRHILVRDALYGQWPSDERAKWHLRAARALQERHGTAPGSRSAEIAAHFLEAESIGGAEQAVLQAVAAGIWAREQLAFEEAVVQFERALDLGDRRGTLNGAERCDLLIELGVARNACGSREVARHALDEAAATARRLRDGQRLAKAALAASPGFFAIETGVEDRSLICLLETALSLCSSTNRSLRAQLLCRLAMALYWSGDAARRFRLADEAWELALRSGEPRVTAYAAITRFATGWSPDNLEERFEHADRLVDGAESSGELDLMLMARVFRISTLLERGDVAAYSREVKSLQRIVETGRYPQARWYPLMYRAALHLLTGRIHQLEARAREFGAAGERFGDANAGASMAVHLVLISLLKDEPVRAYELVRSAADSAHAVPAHRAALALCAARAGRRQEAVGEVRQLCASGFAAIPRDLFWLFAMTVLGEAIAVLGEREYGRSCYELLSPYRGRHCTIGYGIALWSPVDRALGLLAELEGDSELAEAHLRKALEMCEYAGARGLSVGTRLDLVRVLDRRREPSCSRRREEIAAEALREARELGLSLYVRELRERRERAHGALG